MGFQHLGWMLSAVKKLICMEFGYPKGLILKGHEDGAVKMQRSLVQWKEPGATHLQLPVTWELGELLASMWSGPQHFVLQRCEGLIRYSRETPPSCPCSANRASI